MNSFSFPCSCFDKNWILQLNSSGQINHYISQGERTSILCNFKGKIKELNDHLDNSCPLKTLNCWFEPFGCNYECPKDELQEHLISKMQFHFDLVMKVFQQHQNYKITNYNKCTENDKEATIGKRKNEIRFFHVFNTKFCLSILKTKKLIQAKANEIQKLKEEIELKTKQFFEKENEVKKPQRDFQQEVLKSDVDFEDFVEKKEHQQSQHNDAEEKIVNLSQDNQKLLQLSNNSDNEGQKKSGNRDHLLLSTQPSSLSFSSFSHVSIPNYDQLRSIELLKTFSGNSGRVWILANKPKYSMGRLLCSACCDKTVRLWDIKTSKQLQVLDGHTDIVWCVDFSPLQSNSNGNSNIGDIGGIGYTICSGSRDKTIRFWDVLTVKELIVLKHEGYVTSVKYPRDRSGFTGSENIICSGSYDKTVRLWDIRTNKVIHVFRGHTREVTCVQYASGSVDVICSGSWDNTIRFWDIRNTKQIHVIKGNGNEDGGICSIQFPSRGSDTKRNMIKHKVYGNCGYITTNQKELKENSLHIYFVKICYFYLVFVSNFLKTNPKAQLYFYFSTMYNEKLFQSCSVTK
ncbi:G-protein beta WD-40 repeats containing protein [Reticulomyxa filosa]|uniref:G-protein beta WD-40 repeats containing protein n=1 Tax=Reticulomyxa filosa TaxID=46433 RepID=X6MRY9_RETFI|nr:G-protein beta WD-40 repeats containing protein [Reticulomyxa filosa]|eukprot:ETO16768.1 G-protein beta WD-40 repeats containing protein [Reticulomyxa filosa]